MRVVVVSCWKYRDAWPPFFALLRKFWPECPYEKWIITDRHSGDYSPDEAWMYLTGENTSWCDGLAHFAESCGEPGTPCLVFQEDFLLNAPVRQDLIDHALHQMQSRNAGMVRLYPCPGATDDYGDSRVGIVKKGTPYLVSCQASIWKPEFLHAIASQCGDTPSDFEIRGTKIAESLPDEVLAWKRESQPWPLEYLCSAIGRSLWSQDAKKLCDLHGIEVDWSMRGFQPA